MVIVVIPISASQRTTDLKSTIAGADEIMHWICIIVHTTFTTDLQLTRIWYPLSIIHTGCSVRSYEHFSWLRAIKCNSSSYNSWFPVVQNVQRSRGLIKKWMLTGNCSIWNNFLCLMGIKSNTWLTCTYQPTWVRFPFSILHAGCWIGSNKRHSRRTTEPDSTSFYWYNVIWAFNSWDRISSNWWQ